MGLQLPHFKREGIKPCVACFSLLTSLFNLAFSAATSSFGFLPAASEAVASPARFILETTDKYWQLGVTAPAVCTTDGDRLRAQCVHRNQRANSYYMARTACQQIPPPLQAKAELWPSDCLENKPHD